MDKPPTEDDGTASWKCEECASSDANCDSEPLRRSERISLAKEARHKRMKLQETSSVRREKQANLAIHGRASAHTEKSPQEKSSDYLQKNHNVDGTEDLTIKKRRLVLDDEKSESLEGPLNVSCDQGLEVGKYVSEPINATFHQSEDSEPTKVNLPNLNVTHGDPRNMSSDLPYAVPNKCSQAEPITDPIWRYDSSLHLMYSCPLQLLQFHLP